ncbi:MAG: zinc metalloprotease HtpX [Candidatus Thermoplasmatota archaeon]|nr:zinc metalloprotease HtpX [Candidatus Thermoplasmatota archaeon]MCL5964119.1 zinc metalloprotease HtpX [Candidatus Thermoplasmatota archaeon]
MLNSRKLRMSSLLSILFLFFVISFFFLLLLAVISLVVTVSNIMLYAIILVIFAVMFIGIQWAISPYIVKWSVHLKKGMEVTPQNNPMIYSIVSELAKKADVKMPRIYIIRESEPNAFVFGRTVKDTYMVIHSGLLDILNAEELRAVLGHEIGHIKHRDVVTITVISALPLFAYIVARLALDSVFFTGGGGGRKGSLFLAIVVAGILSFVVYIIAQLTVLRISRLREFYADNFSGNITEEPSKLVSSLSKITYRLAYMPEEKNTRSVRAFYAVDPYNAMDDMNEMKQKIPDNATGVKIANERELRKRMEEEAHSNFFTKIHRLFATHPPTYKRIIALLDLEKELNKVK